MMKMSIVSRRLRRWDGDAVKAILLWPYLGNVIYIEVGLRKRRTLAANY